MTTYQDGNDLVKKIQIAISRGVVRLWRNNSGQAWQGDVVRNPDGSITIRHPRVVHFGLAEGSADLIGFREVEIKRHHVGYTMPVFVSIEAKLGTGRLRNDQNNWLAFCKNSGALAGVAKSIEQAKSIVDGTPGFPPL
jgi:hypothetical protein